MTDAEFQSRVTADIKSIVARCVCGAEDYPDVERVSSYRQTYRITCDACGRILYAPTQTECVRDWERIGAKDDSEIKELVHYLKLIEHATAPKPNDRGGHENAYSLARKALSFHKWGTI